MTEFTKGEWQIHRGYPKPEDILIVAILPNRGAKSICEVTNLHISYNAEANAHLIASAPALYEALRSWLVWFADWRDIKKFPPLPATEKALATAEGRD